MSTKIEWCDETWNPVVGCTKVSPGCANCYAARMASRFNRPGEAFDGTAEGGNWTGKVLLKPDKLDQPLHWRKPRRVFVNSMSDLFHDDVPDAFIHRVFRVMDRTPRHTYMVLTKRPERMVRWMNLTTLPIEGPLPNVWLGVSVEDQATADERIPWLLKTPAAVRFVSAEPLLGPVDPRHIPLADGGELDSLKGIDTRYQCHYAGKLDWVIAGGETGPGARPAHPDWFRSLRDQCAAAGVPYFHKQAGEWVEGFRSPLNMPHPDWCALQYRGMTALTKGNMFNPFEAGHPGWKMMHRVGKRAAGRLLDGVEHNAFPEETR